MVEVKTVVVADEGFEEDYERFVSKKEKLHDEIFAKAQREFEEKSAKYDLLISEVSHEEQIEVEVPEEAVEAVADAVVEG